MESLRCYPAVLDKTDSSERVEASSPKMTNQDSDLLALFPMMTVSRHIENANVLKMGKSPIFPII